MRHSFPFLPILLVIGLALSVFWTPPAYAQSQEARSAFTRSLQIYRKALRVKDEEEKLKLYKKAMNSLIKIIDEFPDDSLSLKLISGDKVGNHDWLTFIEKHIFTLERKFEKENKTLQKKRNAEKLDDLQKEFERTNQTCLKTMTPQCLLTLLRRKVPALNLQKNPARILEKAYMTALKDLALGDDEKILRFIHSNRPKVLTFLKRLILQDKEELAVTLLIRAGDAGYRQQFHKRGLAKRHLHFITAQQKNVKIDHAINIRKQLKSCKHMRPSRYTNRQLGTDHIITKQRRLLQKIRRALCNQTPVMPLISKFIKIHQSPMAREYRKKGSPQGYAGSLSTLMPQLSGFGHSKIAIYVALMIPANQYNWFYAKKNNEDRKLLQIIHDLIEFELIQRLENE